jgi:hypothetical protein
MGDKRATIFFFDMAIWLSKALEFPGIIADRVGFVALEDPPCGLPQT